MVTEGGLRLDLQRPVGYGAACIAWLLPGALPFSHIGTGCLQLSDDDRIA